MNFDDAKELAKIHQALKNHLCVWDYGLAALDPSAPASAPVYDLDRNYGLPSAIRRATAAWQAQKLLRESGQDELLLEEPIENYQPHLHNRRSPFRVCASDFYNSFENRIEDDGFLANWAEVGFPMLESSDELFAASLMCTSTEGLVLADIHMPGRTIVFPFGPTNNLFNCSYAILILGALGDAQLHLISVAQRRLYHMSSDTLDELLFVDPAAVFGAVDDRVEGVSPAPQSWAAFDRLADASERRIFNMLRHYVVGMLLAYQEKRNWKYEGTRLARKTKLRGYPPNHRLAILGRNVRADMRNAVKRYLNEGSKKGPSFQFIVRGHQRNQAFGPEHSLRRLQWIEPYWKGPEEAIIHARTLSFLPPVSKVE
jgi:hypothetical protein